MSRRRAQHLGRALVVQALRPAVDQPPVRGVDHAAEHGRPHRGGGVDAAAQVGDRRLAHGRSSSLVGSVASVSTVDVTSSIAGLLRRDADRLRLYGVELHQRDLHRVEPEAGGATEDRPRSSSLQPEVQA